LNNPSAGRARAIRRPHVAVTALAFSLLAVALIVYYMAVLRVDLHNSWIRNLDPHPDADEYVASAISAAREGTFWIHNAGRMVPSRYPFGFPLLMAPLVWLGVEPVTVSVRFNQLLGLVIVLAAFYVFWRAGDRLAAGLTSLFMATMPGLLTLSRSTMSDELGAAIIVAALYCYWRYVRSTPGHLTWGIAGSALLALGIWVRTPNLMYLSLLAGVGLFGQPGSWRQRIRTTAVFGLAFLVAVSPVLVYNHLSFDHPLKTGYDYWLPQPDGGSSTSPIVAFAPTTQRAGFQGWNIMNELIQRERGMNMAVMFGIGSYLNPTLVLLTIVSAIMAVRTRDRASVVIGGAAVVAFLPVLLLRTHDIRNWFVFPLIMPFVVGRQMSRLFRDAVRPSRRDWGTIVAAVFLCAAAAAGWPGERGTFETARLMRVAHFRGHAGLYEAVTHLGRLTETNRTLVITDFNTSYVYALTDGDRIISPYRAHEMPTFNQDWFPPEARRAQLREALSSGRTVYALLMRRPPEQFVPAPKGYEWDEVWRGRGKRGAVIARLVKQ
jgi:4-amino-4-deoxy-L-arabinose transferase-like glycosyltransferase